MEMRPASVVDRAAPEAVTATGRDIRLPIDALDFLWLELTPHCNLSCVHCYADSNPQRPLHENMELKDWIDILSQAAGLGCRGVQFIGGEPTLYPGLIRLIEHAKSAGFTSIEVFTNGTALTQRLKDALRINRVKLALSLYSDQDAVHDGIVQQTGSLAKTKDAIRWAVGAGLEVRAAVIVMAENSGHEGATKRMLEALGVASIRVDRIRAVGRGTREAAVEPSLSELCGRCGQGQLSVSSDGNVYPCVFSRAWPMGRADSGLEAILNNKELHDFRGSLRAARATACRDEAASMCGPEKDPGQCGPEKDPGKCGPEKDPGQCGPEKDPGQCGPEKDPGQCGPEKPSMAGDARRSLKRASSASDPCSPETPPTPCGPETPTTCGPEKPPPDCAPERPSTCAPEKPTGPCPPENA